MKTLPSRQGFTLIEMLVVISLIGILATLAIVSYTGTQKSARDTQRKSDTKQYQNAVEIFASKNNGLYPSETNAAGVSAATTLCADILSTTCPEDPRAADDATFSYKYQTDGSGGASLDAATYVIWAKLENSENYWVVCSNGKVGTKPQTGFSVSGGICPL